jgi:hypothetical protein
MMKSSYSEGPRHFAWRSLQRQRTLIKRAIDEFNVDLASIKENNPACRDLAIQPIMDDSPELPPEPSYSS